MTRGVDLSKFQSASAMDGSDFVILNVEDPSFADKARHAHELGIPWDIYKWIYPPGALDDAGRPIPDAGNGAASFAIAKALVDRTNIPGREPGYWADYEHNGVTANQVREWFAAGDAASVKVGWYTYLDILHAEGNHAPDRPLWLAYYPKPDDGSYQPSMSDDASACRAAIHQFTSTKNKLDVNVVLHTEWWDEWAGDVDDPRHLVEEDDDMLAIIVTDGPDEGLWITTEFSIQAANTADLSPGRSLKCTAAQWEGWKADIQQKRAALLGGALKK